MSQFAGVAFRIRPDDGKWPEVSRDESGIPTLTALVDVASRTDSVALHDKVATLLGVRRARGSNAIAVSVDNAAASGTLVVPTGSGGSTSAKTYTAYLTRYVPRPAARVGEWGSAEVTFLILSDVTP